jgi:hypothetical protein
MPLSGPLRLLLGLTPAMVVGALAAPALLPVPARAVTVGVADQQPAFLTEPAFRRTRLGHVRRLVAWDALASGWQRAELDRWMLTARDARMTVLVTFGRSRTDPDDLPTPERYAAAFRAFRARYPWVREFSTWNEANMCGERTCRRARLVAAWYRTLRTTCPRCTLLAADLVDQPNLAAWARAFRRHATVQPTRWGLHNYLDANRGGTTYTRRALAATRGQLWLTETGGLIARNNRSPTRIPEGFAHAPRATDHLFRTIRRVSGRIQRIYLYHWIAERPPASWDSALLNHRLRPRRSYTVLRAWLARLHRARLLTGRRPARATARARP